MNILKKRNIEEAIISKNIEELKKIVKDLCNIEYSEAYDLPKRVHEIVEYYYNESCEYAKRVFEDKSTCDISNGIKETVPYQIGLIKVYSRSLLKK